MLWLSSKYFCGTEVYLFDGAIPDEIYRQSSEILHLNKDRELNYHLQQDICQSTDVTVITSWLKLTNCGKSAAQTTAFHSCHSYI